MGIPVQGIIVPLVTPFNEAEDVDFEGFSANVSFLLETDVHGLVVLPTAGEAPSLTLDERLRLIDLTLEISRERKPVIVGVGGLNIRETQTLIRHAEHGGADGLFVISPYFYKLTTDEYLKYYKHIGEFTDLDLMMYNSTYADMPLTPAMVEELAEIPNIVALKEGNQLQMGEVVRLVGDQISIFTSRDIYLYETLALGGHGAIAFSANVLPDYVVSIFKAYSSNEFSEARKLQFKLNELVLELISRSYPAPLKAAMNLVGLSGGYVRYPLSNLNQEEVNRLSSVLVNFREFVQS